MLSIGNHMEIKPDIKRKKMPTVINPSGTSTRKQQRRKRCKQGKRKDKCLRD